MKVLVECTTLYFDKELDRRVQVGEIFEVSEERAKVLVDNNVSKILEVNEEQFKEAKQIRVKRATRRK